MARHKNFRVVPEGAFTKDEALKFLGVSITTLDYYLKKGYLDTFKAGKFRYITIESCKRLHALPPLAESADDRGTVLQSPLNKALNCSSKQKWLTTMEFSRLTGLTVHTIANKCVKGELDCVKGVVNRWHINPEEVKRYNERYHSAAGKRTVTVREAAEICGYTVGTMRKYVYAGVLETVKMDGKHLIFYDSLMEFTSMMKRKGLMPSGAFSIGNEKARRQARKERQNGGKKE